MLGTPIKSMNYILQHPEELAKYLIPEACKRGNHKFTQRVMYKGMPLLKCPKCGMVTNPVFNQNVLTKKEANKVELLNHRPYKGENPKSKEENTSIKKLVRERIERFGEVV